MKVWKEWLLLSHVFECLAIRERNCLGWIGRYGIVGVGIALLEDVCQWDCLKFQKPKPGGIALFTFPVDLELKFLATTTAI